MSSLVYGVEPRASPSSVKVSSLPCVYFCASIILGFFVLMAVTPSRVFFQLLGYVTPSCVVYSAAWLCYSVSFCSSDTYCSSAAMYSLMRMISAAL